MQLIAAQLQVIQHSASDACTGLGKSDGLAASSTQSSFLNLQLLSSITAIQIITECHYHIRRREELGASVHLNSVDFDEEGRAGSVKEEGCCCGQQVFETRCFLSDVSGLTLVFTTY